MTKKEYDKIYNKFLNNNLPTPFYDRKRCVFEYVNGLNIRNSNKRQVIRYNNLTEALEDVVCAGFFYPYKAKIIKEVIEDGEKVIKIAVDETHTHSFESVVNALYHSPESFSITKDQEEYYSKQELEYLRKVQKYLQFIGLKDELYTKRSNKRYKNKNQAKYETSYTYTRDSKIIENIINGNINYLVKYCEPYFKYEDKEYYSDEYKVLLVDENGDYRVHLEITKSVIKKYKDIKNEYILNDLKDNDKICILYFNILEVFAK